MSIISLCNGILSAVPLGLIWAIMVMGLFISFRILDFADLTVDGSLATGAAVSVTLIAQGINPYLSVFLAFCAGMLAGLVTALLNTTLNIPPLLAGILTMTALYSINLRIMGKANVSINNQPTVYSIWGRLGLPSTVELPFGIHLSAIDVLVGTLLFVIIIFVVLYWFFGTEIGYAIRATGDNGQMVRAQGVNTNHTKIIGLVLSNGLVAVSGALLAQNQQFAEVSMGVGTIVIGLASIIIGEVLFGIRTFKNTLISIVIGSLLYRILIAVVLEFGMNPNDIKLLTAILIAIALSLPSIKSKLTALKKTRSGTYASS